MNSNPSSSLRTAGQAKLSQQTTFVVRIVRVTTAT
jgi:hypothetical protein